MGADGGHEVSSGAVEEHEGEAAGATQVANAEKAGQVEGQREADGRHEASSGAAEESMKLYDDTEIRGVADSSGKPSIFGPLGGVAALAALTLLAASRRHRPADDGLHLRLDPEQAVE